MHYLLFAKVHSNLLSLAGVEGEAVFFPPLCKKADLLSVGHLIIVGDESHHSGVTSKLGVVI